MFQFCSRQFRGQDAVRIAIEFHPVFRCGIVAKSSEFRPEKFHRDPELSKQIINFRALHLTPECCISETAFWFEADYYSRREMDGRGALMPGRHASDNTKRRNAGERK
jgi:hypothetical protein